MKIESIALNRINAGIYKFDTTQVGEDQVMTIDYNRLLEDNLRDKYSFESVTVTNARIDFYPIGDNNWHDVLFVKDGVCERWQAISLGSVVHQSKLKTYEISSPKGILTIAVDRVKNGDVWQIVFNFDITIYSTKKFLGDRVVIKPFSERDELNLHRYDAQFFYLNKSQTSIVEDKKEISQISEQKIKIKPAKKKKNNLNKKKGEKILTSIGLLATNTAENDTSKSILIQNKGSVDPPDLSDVSSELEKSNVSD
jgi:hypothetical protein